MTYVESKYSSCWKGIVVDTFDIRSSYPKRYSALGLVVLILIDKNGHKLRKRQIKWLNEAWLNEIKPFDVSWVNPDWYKNLPKR